MSELELFADLITQLPFVVLIVVILERQAKQKAELVNFLVLQFKELTKQQFDDNQKLVDSLCQVNLQQAERHQKMIDSLLGLIDEMAARANPDKLTSTQIKNIEQYLKSQDR